MSNREYAKTQIDMLPDVAVERVVEYISFQRYSLGLFESDDDYLASIPGMTKSIKEGMATPLSDCHFAKSSFKLKAITWDDIEEDDPMPDELAIIERYNAEKPG